MKGENREHGRKKGFEHLIFIKMLDLQVFQQSMTHVIKSGFRANKKKFINYFGPRLSNVLKFNNFRILNGLGPSAESKAPNYKK